MISRHRHSAYSGSSKPSSRPASWTRALRVGGRVGGERDVKVASARWAANYHVGDAIVVCFRATRDCYLTLLNLGTSGRLTIRFPNALYPDNFLYVPASSMKSQVKTPGQDYGFEYRLQGPPGTERLKAIATLDRVQLLETHLRPAAFCSRRARQPLPQGISPALGPGSSK